MYLLNQKKNILEGTCTNLACFFPHKLWKKTKVKDKMLTLPKILEVAYHMKAPLKGFNWYKNELCLNYDQSYKHFCDLKCRKS
jgi:hypothetical protein